MVGYLLVRGKGKLAGVQDEKVWHLRGYYIRTACAFNRELFSPTSNFYQSTTIAMQIGFLGRVTGLFKCGIWIRELTTCFHLLVKNIRVNLLKNQREVVKFILKCDG